MKLSEKQIREGKKEIQELTNFIFKEETFLIDLLSEHVNMKGAIFFESKEAEVDEGIIAFYGFFFTKKRNSIIMKAKNNSTMK
ncbi:MAG: hypothetical protein LUG51_10105 [Tannerellaceae bacterium]|nr:hypothetical protein [Tannerellaceae bacterium]